MRGSLYCGHRPVILCSPLCDCGPLFPPTYDTVALRRGLSKARCGNSLPLPSLPFVLLGCGISHICVHSCPQFFLIILCRKCLNSTPSTLSAVPALSYFLTVFQCFPKTHICWWPFSRKAVMFSSCLERWVTFQFLHFRNLHSQPN